MEAYLARVPTVFPALKKRAAQIKVLLMDVDGTMTDGSVTLLSQPDGTALEIKTFDAHDGQGLRWLKLLAFAPDALQAVKVLRSYGAPMK